MKDKTDSNGSCGVSPAFIDGLAESQPALYSYISALLAGDVETAKDVLQETDLYIWNNRGNYDASKGPFLPWAKAMTRAQVQKARSLGQREKARTVYTDDVFDLVASRASEEPEPPDDRLHALNVCLNELSPSERKLLGRHYAKREKLEALAASSRMTLAALKMKLLRLRDRLGACIRDRLCRMERGEEELPDVPTEFESILSLLLDSRVADSTFVGDAFNAALRDDPASLQRFLAQVDVHALLAYRAEKAETRVLQRRAAWRYAARRVGLPALAAAACLALLVGGAVLLNRAQNAAPVPFRAACVVQPSASPAVPEPESAPRLESAESPAKAAPSAPPLVAALAPPLKTERKEPVTMDTEILTKSAAVAASAVLALTTALPARAEAKGDREAHSSPHFIDAREPAAAAAPAHFIDARLPAAAGSTGAKTWTIDTSKPLGTVIMLI